MIRVEIVNVFLTAKGDEFIILLRGPDDERTLPISVGQLEAQSIAMKLYHVDFPRPLTHDLFKSVFDRIDCKVVKAIIYALSDNTFYANLYFERGEELIEIDSRPSDAIALAIRWEAPIYVEEKVLDEAGVILPTDMDPGKTPLNEAEQGESSTIETLNSHLQKAISQERYEDAGRIRDEINKYKKAN